MSVLSFNSPTEQERDRGYQHMKKVLEDNELNQKLLKDFKEKTISLDDIDLLYKQLLNLL
ncbi:MAG: hypothetical protein PHR87_07465 [Sulfurospirillaceae bacterium]|nr:hypothetical protein [Sulfurospirillaceae bacterium]